MSETGITVSEKGSSLSGKIFEKVRELREDKSLYKGTSIMASIFGRGIEITGGITLAKGVAVEALRELVLSNPIIGGWTPEKGGDLTKAVEAVRDLGGSHSASDFYLAGAGLLLAGYGLKRWGENLVQDQSDRINVLVALAMRDTLKEGRKEVV